MVSKDNDEKRVTIVINEDLDYKFRKWLLKSSDLNLNGIAKPLKRQLIYGLMTILMKILNSFNMIDIS